MNTLFNFIVQSENMNLIKMKKIEIKNYNELFNILMLSQLNIIDLKE